MALFGFSFGVDVVIDGDYALVSGIRYKEFKRFIQKFYASNTFLDRFTRRTWTNSISIHQWYIPELIYLLTKAVEERYLPTVQTKKVIEKLYEKTWWGQTTREVQSVVDMSAIKSVLIPDLKLKDYQEEFLTDIYWQKKVKYRLRGYLLSLSQGLGKSICSLALSVGLHKLHTVVICPLSTVKNVWANEINKWYRKQQNIWTPDKDPMLINKKTDFVVVNYEGIEKVKPYILKHFTAEDTIIVVDECHNFKDVKSLRTKQLFNLTNEFKSQDILMMSGTPLKALGIEVVPIFKMLDPMFTPELEEDLSKLTRYTKVMNDLLRNRLGLMMYRVLKEDVLQLPEKHEYELKLKIPNGDYYTLENVKKLVVEFAEERREYYKSHYKEFEDTYKACLKEFEKTLFSKDDWRDYKRYLDNVLLIQTKGYGFENMPTVVAVNKYEKEVIIPALPVSMRAEFRACKSVVKYTELKILGEILGGLLNALRTEMTTELIGKEVLDIIRDAAKKTILFSSYTDSIKIAESVCTKAKMSPMVITGENTKEASTLLDRFKKDPKLNPLIASIKAMSTGHTITEANTVIFLNVPFRSVDYDQASDRVYRIGQDCDVYIYKLVLDTGSEPNLSTRMQDIIAWSKESFDTIIGDNIEDDAALGITGDVIKSIHQYFTDWTSPLGMHGAEYRAIVDRVLASIKSLFT